MHVVGFVLGILVVAGHEHDVAPPGAEPGDRVQQVGADGDVAGKDQDLGGCGMQALEEPGATVAVEGERLTEINRTGPAGSQNVRDGGRPSLPDGRIDAGARSVTMPCGRTGPARWVQSQARRARQAEQRRSPYGVVNPPGRTPGPGLAVPPGHRLPHGQAAPAQE